MTRRIVKYFGVAVLLLALIAGGIYAALLHYAGGSSSGPEGDQRGLLASVIANALSSPEMKISIGAVDGALSSDATLRNLEIADAKGVWLRLDRARLVWSRAALLNRQLAVNSLDIGHLEILRRPLPSAAPKPAEDGDSEAASPFALPDLPLKVVVGAFSLNELDLGADVVGVAAELAAQGHATLGRAADGLDLAFDLKRRDAPGDVRLQLAYDPGTTDLRLVVAAHEPAGGLIAHAANLDGLPPVDLDLNGAGKLDSFKAQLAFSAGPLANVAGGARLERREAARALNLDLDGDIEKILPPWLGPVFIGQTRVTGAMIFADDGGFGLDKLQILARGAQLDATGRLGVDQQVEAHVALRSLGENGGAARTGDVEIGALEFRLDALGPLLAPALDLALHVADASAPAGRIGRLDAKITARPDGPATDPKTRVDIAADASGEGLDFKDQRLANALGSAFDLTLRARAAATGNADVSIARLQSGAGEIEAKGLFGLRRINGHVAFVAPDLRRFSELAGMDLAGALKGDADLTGNPKKGRIDARLDIAGEQLATGIEAADALIGGRLNLSGLVGATPDGVRFDGLRLAAANFDARLDGRAERDKADVDFAAEAADLGKIGKDFAGRATARGKLTGTLDHPDATLTLALTDVRSMGRAIPRLTIDLSGKDLIDAPNGRLALDGVVGGKPAGGALSFARDPEQTWRFASDKLSLGSVALAGQGALSAQNLLDGAFTLRAGDLDDLTPLALQKLSGRLDGEFSFSAAKDQQAAKIQLKAVNLRAAQAAVERLDVDLRGDNLFGAPRLDGTVAIDRASVSGETIPRLRLTASGAGDASDIVLSAEARGISVEGKGKLFASAPVRLDLSAFEARGAGQRLSLAGPARFAFPPGGVEIRGLTLASGAGRLTLDGKAGETLDFALSAKALPLALARLASPDLDLGGTLDASAKIGGRASAPTGDWRLDLANVSAPQLRAAGLANLGLRANGRLEGRRTTIAADVALPRNGSARLTGFVPLDPDGALDVSLRASLDAALANTALADGGQSLAGRMTIDARAQGSIDKPQLAGTASLANGAFQDPLAGVRFERIDALLRARGDSVVIESFSAGTAGGGTLSASGNVRVAPDAGFPASLRITGRRAQLVSNDIVTAVGDLALDISGPLARRPRIGGKVSFDSIDIRVPDRVPASLRPLDNTRHVQPTPPARARLALMAKNKARRAKAGPPFNADLNVAVNAPARIFVRGRGIDAELGGDVTLTGDLAAPTAHGGFRLRRGTFAMAGRRLEFTRGAIAFEGGVIPNLDFVAQSSAGDVTAQVEITGPADQPQFAFTSSPQLPQDEVISRLLFNSSAGGLTPLQGLQLAQTVAEFSGNGGPGVLERMRRTLGVDSLNVLLGADGNPSVGASRYITRNVNVGVRTGVKPEDSGVTMGVDVWKNLRVQGEASANGSVSAGAAFHWEYDAPPRGQ